MAILCEGSVRERPLSEIFWAIHWRSLTGCLTLKQPPHRKDLYFREGIPFFARSTMKSEALGRFLLARHLIDPDGYERATLQSIQDHQKLGDALVKCGALTPDALDAALLEQVRERFLAAFGLKSASFVFDDALPMDAARQAGRIDVLPLLRDGIARHVDLEALTTALASWGTRPIQRTRSYNALILTVELAPDELRVASATAGSRRIGELMAELGMDAPRLLAILYLLRSIGMLKGAGEPEPRLEFAVAPADDLDRKLSGITGIEPPELPQMPLAPLEPPPPSLPAPSPGPPPLPEPLPPPDLAEPAAETKELPIPPPEPPPEVAATLPKGKTGGYVPRTFGFVRHDEEEVSFDLGRGVASSSMAGSRGSMEAGLPGPVPGRAASSFGFVRHGEESVELDASAIRQPVAPVAAQGGAAPPTPGERGDVKNVIEASQAYAKGLRALGEGDVAGAEVAFEEALHLHPGEPEYVAGLGTAFYLSARVSGDRSKLARALALAGQALSTQPRLAPALWLQSLCYRDMGRAEEAEAIFLTALGFDPSLEDREKELLARATGGASRGKGGAFFDRTKGIFRRKD